MKKAIFYYPVFWIIMALTLIALDFAQVAAGVSWYRVRYAAGQPTPSPPILRPISGAQGGR